MQKISIGVCAFNEERNCRQVLEALLNQDCRQVQILEIVVVSSGSTDRTDEIIQMFAEFNPKLRLIREPVRRGKSAAVNTYLAAKHPHANVCVIASADIVPDSRAIEHLSLALLDPQVGVAGGRPMPVNKADRFLGFVVQLQWKLHHLISLKHPKCGEMIAFRSDLAESIPAESPVDEASLEAMAAKKNLRLKYIPEATFVNRGPDTLSDLISQRRRIASGHCWLQRTGGYKVATKSSLVIMKALFLHPPRRPIEWVWTLGAICLEAWCRLLGSADCYMRPQVHQTWEIVQSTKASFLPEELAGTMDRNKDMAKHYYEYPV
jgi:glycosyltransferase involved in cell wall biosynthesis